MKLFPSLNPRFPEMFLKAVEQQRSADVAEIAQMQRQLNIAKLHTVNSTAVGNVGTGVDNLMTYDLPAGILKNNHDRLEFSCGIEIAANGNTKQLKVYFGASELYDTTAFAHNGGDLVIDVTIIRTGVTSQTYGLKLFANSGSITDTARVGGITEDLNAAVTFKCTAEATDNDDILQRYLTVNWWPGG